MTLTEILEIAVREHSSDIFIVAGRPVCFKTNGVLTTSDDERLVPQDAEKLILEIYATAQNRSHEKLDAFGDDDFSFAIKGLSRFRANIYKQRGSLAAVIRVITFDIPDADSLGIPSEIISLGDLNNGLVLVTGPAGSGKSTTLACIIDHINETKDDHIITLEDPLEYLHRHKKSIVSQREIFIDTESYVTALKASLRQSPDVILLGEMRDHETIDVAMTAAETGHLIISTLHTIGAVNTIERIIDVFPANQQRQIALQLTMVLRAVVSQQLVPSVDGTLIPVFEIMKVTPAIRTMIRDGKIHQINGVIQTSGHQNMVTMDDSLVKLFHEGRITQQTAIKYAANADLIEKKLRV